MHGNPMWYLSRVPHSISWSCHGQVAWNEWGMDGMVIHAIIPKKRAIYQVPSSKLHSYLKKPL